MRRGSIDSSAPMSKLGFSVTLVSYESDKIHLKFKFENPLSVSIGREPDVLVIEFVEPQLFTSKETGKTLAADSTVIVANIPRQFPSEASYEIAVLAGSTVQVAANTAFLS